MELARPKHHDQGKCTPEAVCLQGACHIQLNPTCDCDCDCGEHWPRGQGRSSRAVCRALTQAGSWTAAPPPLLQPPHCTVSASCVGHRCGHSLELASDSPLPISTHLSLWLGGCHGNTPPGLPGGHPLWGQRPADGGSRPLPLLWGDGVIISASSFLSSAFPAHPVSPGMSPLSWFPCSWL